MLRYYLHLCSKAEISKREPRPRKRPKISVSMHTDNIVASNECKTFLLSLNEIAYLYRSQNTTLPKMTVESSFPRL